MLGDVEIEACSAEDYAGGSSPTAAAGPAGSAGWDLPACQAAAAPAPGPPLAAPGFGALLPPFQVDPAATMAAAAAAHLAALQQHQALAAAWRAVPPMGLPPAAPPVPATTTASVAAPPPPSPQPCATFGSHLTPVVPNLGAEGGLDPATLAAAALGGAAAGMPLGDSSMFGGSGQHPAAVPTMPDPSQPPAPSNVLLTSPTLEMERDLEMLLAGGELK